MMPQKRSKLDLRMLGASYRLYFNLIDIDFHNCIEYHQMAHGERPDRREWAASRLHQEFALEVFSTPILGDQRFCQNFRMRQECRNGSRDRACCFWSGYLFRKNMAQTGPPAELYPIRNKTRSQSWLQFRPCPFSSGTVFRCYDIRQVS